MVPNFSLLDHARKFLTSQSVYLEDVSEVGKLEGKRVVSWTHQAVLGSTIAGIVASLAAAVFNHPAFIAFGVVIGVIGSLHFNQERKLRVIEASVKLLPSYDQVVEVLIRELKTRIGIIKELNAEKEELKQKLVESTQILEANAQTIKEYENEKNKAIQSQKELQELLNKKDESILELESRLGQSEEPKGAPEPEAEVILDLETDALSEPEANPIAETQVEDVLDQEVNEAPEPKDDEVPESHIDPLSASEGQPTGDDSEANKENSL